MPNKNPEQQTLTASEHNISLYDLAEIVYSILKNDKGKWQSVQQYAEKYAGLWVDKVEPNSHFANQILEEVVGIMPYNTSYPPALEKFYKEFEQAFGIKIEGNAEPFLNRLTILIRRAAVEKKYSQLIRLHQEKLENWRSTTQQGESDEEKFKDVREVAKELDHLYRLKVKLDYLLLIRNL